MKNNFDLSGFKKVKKIGEGTYGEVYQVKEITTDQNFAAKISKNTIKEKSRDERLNLKREVDALSQLNHPSVLKFIGYSQTNFEGESKPVIITEYLPHGSLEKLINDSKNPKIDFELSETNKIIILYGIASAMAYIHSNGFIHRDLKPANILVNDLLYPIVADLGFAKIVQKDEDKNETLQTQQSLRLVPKGTPLYLAPEIIINILNDEDIVYTKAMDVYSFAIIIYQLFATDSSFYRLSMFKLFNKVSAGERPNLTSNIPKCYQKLIERCWSQDPALRPTFDEIVETLKSDEFTKGVQMDQFNKYIEYIQKTSLIYPSEKFNMLDSSCQTIVRQAESNSELQFQVGKNLIEGINGFPHNIIVGTAYLSHSANGNCLNGIKYYCKMLIEGELIDRDIEMAKKYLKPLLKTVNDDEKPFIYLLYGKAMINKPNYKVAIHALKNLFGLDTSKFSKEQKLALAEGFFEYGKLLYEGKGEEKKIEEAMEFFEKARSNGFQKQVNDYLSKMENEDETDNNVKKVDLIFLVDGTYSMQFFVDSIKANIVDVSKEWMKKYPDFNFMYGAIIYRDTAVTRLIKDKKFIDHVNYYDLTNDIDEVYHFFTKTKFRGGGFDGPEDWGSGFSYLLNRISWRDNSVKIVIHVCDSPGHGKSFTCKKGFYRRTIKIPKFNKKNSEQENLAIYNTEIQWKSNKWIKHLIEKLAKKNIMFFCMNGKDKAMQCFQATRDFYLKNGGLKYIIMNQFNCIYYDKIKDKFDFTDLNKNMKELLLNSVDISIDATYNDDSQPTDFEIECMEQFDENLHEYEKSVSINRSGMQSDDSVASFSSIGSRSSTLDMFDFDSDMDDSDDENDDGDEEPERNTRHINLRKKNDDDDEDHDNDDDDESNKIVYSKRPTIARGACSRGGSNNRRFNNRGHSNRWNHGRGRGAPANCRGGKNSNRNFHKDDEHSENNENSDQNNNRNQNVHKNNHNNRRGNRNTNQSGQRRTQNRGTGQRWAPRRSNDNNESTESD